jgi:hypothetical protein
MGVFFIGNAAFVAYFLAGTARQPSSGFHVFFTWRFTADNSCIDACCEFVCPAEVTNCLLSTKVQSE